MAGAVRNAQLGFDLVALGRLGRRRPGCLVTGADVAYVVHEIAH
jgi:hypothetical protein